MFADKRHKPIVGLQNPKKIADKESTTLIQGTDSKAPHHVTSRNLKKMTFM